MTEAIQQTRVFALWKAVEYAGLAAFMIVVPRLMGPTIYGQFASIVSLLTLMVSSSGLGGLATFGRFLPEYEIAGRKREVRALFVHLFWTRTFVAALMALGLLALLPSLLPGLSKLTAGVAAVSLLAGAAATTCFQVFYGLKRFGRWSCQEALTRITMVVLLGAFGAASTLDRAVLALGFTNLGFLALGLFWTQDLFKGERTPFNLTSLLELLRFGFTVFVANLILTTVWRAGEPATLLLSGQPAEAAFFSVANAVATSAGFLIMQAVLVTTPSWTSMYVSGRGDALDSSMGHVLRYLTIGSFLAILPTYAVASSLIVWILGSPYAVAATNLKILVLGLPGIVLIALGLSRALVARRPEKALAINIAALSVFALSALALTPRMASLGTSTAVTAAMIGGGAAACRVCRLAPALRAAQFGALVLFGGLSLAVYALPGTPAPVAGIGAVALFAGLLFGTGLLQVAEVRNLVSGLSTQPASGTDANAARASYRLSNAGRNVAYFDEVASTYRQWYVGTTALAIGFRLRRLSVMKLFDQAGGNVLDVGCGPGVFVDEVLKGGCTYWGVDQSPKMIEQCERDFGSTPGTHFRQAAAEALPFPDAFFDAVLCVGVLDRIEAEEPALSELVRVLKTGGSLIVTVPNKASPQILWRDFVVYPMSELARTIYCWATKTATQPSARHRPHGARAFAEQLRAHACDVANITYTGFQILPYPADRLLGRFAGPMMEALEKLSTTRLRIFGAMVVLAAHKRG